MEVRLSDDSGLRRDYTDGWVAGGKETVAPVVLRDTQHRAPLSGARRGSGSPTGQEAPTPLDPASNPAGRARRAARTAHGLRTRLNAALGFAQALELDGLSPGRGEGARQILKGAPGARSAERH